MTDERRDVDKIGREVETERDRGSNTGVQENKLMDKKLEKEVKDATEVEKHIMEKMGHGTKMAKDKRKGLISSDGNERKSANGEVLGLKGIREETVTLKIGKFKLSVKKSLFWLLALNMVLVSSIVIINFFLFSDMPSLFSSINIVAGFIFVFPLVMIRYSTYKTKKEIEDMFPVFLRDFVEVIRGGMTVPHALKSVSRNDYKALSPHVKKMAVQLDWGVPVERVLLNFSKRVDSKLIGRIISSVRESHRFGGNLADTLEALSNTAVEVERLREERSLYLHSQMITGYIIFFVFLAVMVALEKFLVPSLSEVSATGFIGGQATITTSAPRATEEYNTIFRNLILIQGFFAGLAVGKMSEGAIVAGVKHSIFMMLTGFVVFMVATGPIFG